MAGLDEGGWTRVVLILDLAYRVRSFSCTPRTRMWVWVWVYLVLRLCGFPGRDIPYCTLSDPIPSHLYLGKYFILLYFIFILPFILFSESPI
ncbi:hypothetical protein BKA61DRAFT_605998 [Leptodontidium sp. MPI-SDFR-AT-0119]|nr:hypothetical protein BKA61DRAFT_605998 [Leptodontidium sp. MPI-SDFR-AT-0119]